MSIVRGRRASKGVSVPTPNTLPTLSISRRTPRVSFACLASVKADTGRSLLFHWTRAKLGVRRQVIVGVVFRRRNVGGEHPDLYEGLDRIIPLLRQRFADELRMIDAHQELRRVDLRRRKLL